ncbi:MAG: inorganic diphosphatase [Alphaproteobacteria bacterium]|nr:inorganic diphosphatase [Alphaproteobacteria bacterium]
MDLSKLSIGKNPPETVNVVIEIPQGGSPIKYEVDKDSGALLVDRFMSTAMFYPANYGFVPHTLSGDGDPCDVLVIAPLPIAHGAVVASRPIGVLLMKDESGQDEKIIAVPTDKLSPFTAHIKSCADVPKILLDQIEHFFKHYKDLEKGKWVEILRWGDAEEARSLIMDGVERAQKAKAA